MGELVTLKRDKATIKDNIPGVGQTLLIARTDTITAFGTFVDPVVNPEDAFTIDGDHTFAVDDGFAELELDYKKNTFEGEDSADWGSNNKKWTLKGMFYGTGKEVVAAMAEYRNAELIVLAKKLKVGAESLLQFGLENMPARCIGQKWTSGTPDSGSASVEFTIEVFQPDLYFYEGVVTLKA